MRPRPMPRTAALLTIALLAFIATGTAAEVRRDREAGAGAGGPSTRDQAAAWVATEVSRGSVVACDPAMCSALARHGLAAGALRRPAAGPELFQVDVIMVTAAVRNAFGKTLDTAVAPPRLAAFGSGRDRIEVRTVMRYGATGYFTAYTADTAARTAAGAELLRNPRVDVATTARPALSAGRVDPRLLTVLATVAGQDRISITAFGPPAPGADPRVPARQADLITSTSAVRHLLTVQHAPYKPGFTIVGNTLRLHYDAPSPLGLLE